MRQQDTKYAWIKRRESKVLALNAEGTPEARKARKKMNDHIAKREQVNLNGFFGEQRVRGKEKRKGRKIRMSKPFMAAVKAGY